MSDRHEPNPQFTQKLQWQIGVRLRLLDRAGRPGHLPPGPVVAVAGLCLVMMGIGGMAVAASYRIEQDTRREMLLSSLTLRRQLGVERLRLANEESARIEREVEAGTTRPTQLAEADLNVTRAESELRIIDLDLEEVALTGNEPLNDVSSPLVSGRDFMTGRLQVKLSAQEAALDIERQMLQDAEKRAEMGLVVFGAVELAREQLSGTLAGIDALRNRIEIRRQFLEGLIGAVEAELRGLETEADLRLNVLEPRIAAARDEVERLAERQQAGIVDEVTLRQARLRLLQLETEQVRAELDRALIRGRGGQVP